MFSFSYICIIPFIGAFVYLDGHHIVKNNTIVQWNNFKRINTLVSTNYKGFFLVTWISVCMILQAMWISIFQYMNTTITPLEGGKYQVTYIIKGKTYKMVVKPIKGPKKVLLVSDNNQEDVSYKIIPYMGPEDNFHGKLYTPNFFNHTELIFEMSNGDEKIFKNDDDIILS